jgi:pyridoxine 5-phosphate synthase
MKPGSRGLKWRCRAAPRCEHRPRCDHPQRARRRASRSRPRPQIAQAAGADGITIHLREDRRHIRDATSRPCAARRSLPINLEMATTDEMLAIALDFKPHAACLVPGTA